jgi:hypothetical protein
MFDFYEKNIENNSYIIFGRYQRKSDELEILCKKYEGEFDSLSNDKKDIISNLKKELERKTDEILDLNDKLVGLQQAKDSEKEAFEKQLTDLRTEFQETKDNLTNQNNALRKRILKILMYFINLKFFKMLNYHHWMNFEHKKRIC